MKKEKAEDVKSPCDNSSLWSHKNRKSFDLVTRAGDEDVELEFCVDCGLAQFNLSRRSYRYDSESYRLRFKTENA